MLLLVLLVRVCRAARLQEYAPVAFADGGKVRPNTAWSGEAASKRAASERASSVKASGFQGPKQEAAGFDCAACQGAGRLRLRSLLVQIMKINHYGPLGHAGVNGRSPIRRATWMHY